MSARAKAIVLAGDRGPNDAIVRATGLPGKAALEVDGRALVLRVLDALRAARTIDEILLVGPSPEAVDGLPELAAILASGAARRIDAAAGPSASVLAGLAALGGATEVLVTTADHALLSADLVDEVVTRAAGSAADFVFGAAPYDRVTGAHPELVKTAHRLRGGAWCGCNLFFLRTPRAARVVEFWRGIEAERKKPWRQARRVGIGFLAALLARQLTLAEAATRIGVKLGGVRIEPLVLASPDAAVDVDSMDDARYVATLLERRRRAATIERH